MKLIENLLSVAKVNDLVKKQEEKEKTGNKVLIVLAIIGAIAAIALIAYAVYSYLTPDYLDDFDDFDDDFDDDFFDDEEDDIPTVSEEKAE